MAPARTLRRRIFAAALAIPVILGIAPALARATTAEHGTRTTRAVSNRICDFDWQESRREVKRLIRCAARHWRSPGGANQALDVARCESRFNPRAHNPAGYGGVFQHAIRYWPDRADRWGFPDRSVYNGRANIIVSVRMARSDGGWGAWGCA